MIALFSWLRSRPLAMVGLALGIPIVLGGVTLLRRPTSIDAALTATVRRTTLTATLTATGVLAPAQSITYRSPLGGREVEITFLVAEGTRVGEGDLLVRLDTTELLRDLEHANQELRQAQVDLQVADIDWQEGQSAVDSLAAGEGALAIDEAKARLQTAQKKADRLRQEARSLKPLLDRGFITKEEDPKISEDLEQAEDQLNVARRRTEIIVEHTNPQDRQRAQLQLAQKDAQRENVRARLQEAQARVQLLRQQIENCSAYARRPGLVVYEPYLGANPRRKIRVGDHVTGSQGLVTIPDVTGMLVEASVTEGDVHRLRTGQSVAVRLEAFPDLRLTGKVSRIGTLATSSVERPFEDKRFDLIVELDAPPEELRPEMTARVDIELAKREGVLVIPVNAVFEQDGLPVCTVLRTFGVEMRRVQLGESSPTLVEVVTGLREGERVTLMESSSGMAAPGGTTKAPSSMRAVEPGGVLGPR